MHSHRAFITAVTQIGCACLVAQALVACDHPADQSAADARGTSADASQPADAPLVSCPDTTKLVYTVGANGLLRSFDPATLTFHDIGFLPGTPQAIAIARDGTAYVSMN